MTHHAHERPAMTRAALLLLILCAALALYLHFFHSLVVPNPDFFEYRGHARRYLQLTMPDTFKRMPVFPLLIGAFSLVMPGAEPELLAAETLNVLLALVSLWLIHRIAREFVQPATSLAIVALCAVNRAMVYSVAEPMQEITILASMLLVIVLALRASPWAYVAAFVASLTRHEVAMVIPLLVLQDRLTTTGARKTRALLWGALASLGVVGWAWLTLQAPRIAYLNEMLAHPSSGLAFAKGTLRVLSDFLPGTVWGSDLIRRAVFLTELGLIGVGAALLVARHRSRTVLILGSLLTYSAIHVAFPAHVERYIVPIIWSLYLCMAIAIETLIARLRAARQAPAWGLAGLALAAMLAFGLSSTVDYMSMDHVRLRRIQFRRVGEWYRTAARPGDRMAVQFKSTVRYYSGLPERSFLPTKALESTTPEALVEEMHAKGLTYVVWDNKTDPSGFYTRWHRTWLLTLVKARTPAELEPVYQVNEAGNKAIVYRLRASATKASP